MWWIPGSSFWMCWRRVGKESSLGKPLLEEARSMCVGKYKRKTTSACPPETKESREDFEGPDTSSLTAFLLSLLSCTESKSKYKDDKPEEEETVSDERESATGSQNRVVRSRREGDNNKTGTTVDTQAGEELRESVVQKDDKGETPTSVGEDPDADWQLVSETDLGVYRPAPDPATPRSAPASPLKPLVLPDMSEESALIPENLRTVVYSALPTLALGRQWVLLYSTAKHGISLRTLYRKAAIIPGPCLLIAGDRLGAIFGGLLSSPIKPVQKYQGTNESFVFTNVSGDPKIYRTTGSNRYYVLSTDEALAFGGGGHFALYLDADLLNGTSANCETYGNPCLATTEEFVLKDVELWGFAHASRYTPKYASFKEQEEAPGVSSW